MKWASFLPPCMLIIFLPYRGPNSNRASWPTKIPKTWKYDPKESIPPLICFVMEIKATNKENWYWEMGLLPWLYLPRGLRNCRDSLVGGIRKGNRNTGWNAVSRAAQTALVLALRNRTLTSVWTMMTAHELPSGSKDPIRSWAGVLLYSQKKSCLQFVHIPRFCGSLSLQVAN